MASSLELVAVKVLGPVGGLLLGAAALGAGEALGLNLGLEELGGAAIALLVLREVFGFVRWNVERKEPKEAGPVPRVTVVLPQELRAHMQEQVRLLGEIRDAQRRTCLLGEVQARETLLDGIEKAVMRARH